MTIHYGPQPGLTHTRCCSKATFDLPRGDSMTSDPKYVTCWKETPVAERKLDPR